jgi:hypothetical protein
MELVLPKLIQSINLFQSVELHAKPKKFYLHLEWRGLKRYHSKRFYKIQAFVLYSVRNVTEAKVLYFI